MVDQYATVCICLSVALQLLLYPDAAVAQNSTEGLAVGNTAKQVAKQNFQWTAYLMGLSAELDRVKCVEYVLHPTFTPPTRTVCVRGDLPTKAFFLNATGWGTFVLGANVTMKDGNSRYLTHRLHFSVDAEGWYYLKAGFADQAITVPVTGADPADGHFQFKLEIKRIGNDVQVRVNSIDVINDGTAGRTRWEFDVLWNGQNVIHLSGQNYFSLGAGRSVRINRNGLVLAQPGEASLTILGRH